MLGSSQRLCQLLLVGNCLLLFSKQLLLRSSQLLNLLQGLLVGELQLVECPFQLRNFSGKGIYFGVILQHNLH